MVEAPPASAAAMSISPELAEVIDFLRGHAPFDRLTPEQLESAARRIEIIYRRSGEVLLAIGQANTALSVIRRGAVEVHDGAGRLINRLAEGESYGLPSLLTGKPVRNRVTLIEDGLLYLLPVADFNRLRAANPAFEQHFVSTLEERMRAAAEAGGGNELMATPVSRLGSRAPVMVGPEASIREAAQLMSQKGVSSILIGNAERMLGIVTDRDLRNRVLAAGLDPNEPVTRIMTPDPTHLDVHRPVFEAFLVMANRGIHHLPLTREGKPAGMITTRDLVSLQTQHPLYLVRQVGKQDTVEGLQDVTRRMPRMFALMLENGARPEDVMRMLSALTDAVTRQLLRMAEERFGPPPMPYAWLAFGSQARNEQGPHTDQDNGLLLAQTPDEGGADYFETLSKFVCAGLDACGYVFCNGDVMAQNPRWRQPLDVWQGYFRSWMHEPDPKALLHASIFFDQRCVHGDRSLLDALQESLFDASPRHGIFLAVLAKHALTHEVPLGLFRRFVVEHRGEHRDTLDMKKAGSLPLNDLLRVRALAAGIREPGGLARIEGLRRVGRMADIDAAELSAAFRLLARLRLEHQAAQLAAGDKPDNRINPSQLNRIDRDALRDAFLVIRQAQAGLANAFGVQ
jgi:CBS domain-containing protein